MLALSRLNLNGKTDGDKLGFCLDDEFWRAYERKVLSLMVQGFKDRAKFVRVNWRNTAADFNLEDV
jgi:U3 small nucleolar RNA-associated protein 22